LGINTGRGEKGCVNSIGFNSSANMLSTRQGGLDDDVNIVFLKRYGSQSGVNNIVKCLYELIILSN